jgi:hypothetical protein
MVVNIRQLFDNYRWLRERLPLYHIKIVTNLGPYTQHFIFFVTYELAQYDWVSYYISTDEIVMDKNSSFLDSFVSYEEIDVLWIQSLGSYSQHFIFFITYKLAQLSRVSYHIKLDKIVRYKL